MFETTATVEAVEMRRDYLTGPQAAARAQITLPTVHAWIRRYPPLGAYVGGRVRVNPAELDRILRGEVQFTKRAQAA